MMCIRLVSLAALVPVLGLASKGRKDLPSPQSTVADSIWGVTTTIFAPTPAVRIWIDELPSNQLVVVGDKKTNSTVWREYERSAGKRVQYLSPHDQLQRNFRSAPLLPWNHFGRKNIGFLVAISNGARWVFDFDDDNVLNLPIGSTLLPSIYAGDLSSMPIVNTHHHLYNPYPEFDPRTDDGQHAFVWPRGFPLDFIASKETFQRPEKRSNVSLANVHVFQSLADNNPDVDAIYRMTRPLPLTFSVKGKAVALPIGTYSPFNAQATLFRASALWGLLLPVTVSPRVTDIWRSYIIERLLWEIRGHVAFTSAFVTQYRNPHSYQQDFNDELDVYSKVGPLLDTLAAWTSQPGESFPHAYVDLVGTLVRAGILGAADSQLASAWVNDLSSNGYKWPSITSPQRPRTLQKAKVVDERKNDLTKGDLTKNN